MNKVADGTAKLAEAQCDFNEGLLKFNPNLFNFYEKMNKKAQHHKNIGSVNITG